MHAQTPIAPTAPTLPAVTPATVGKRPQPWSEAEDRAIVTDYLANLAAVTRGMPVSKAATRRALLPQLNGRNESSVEFKRCNVSAVLVDLGHAYWQGYRPASNYQRRLVETVRAALASQTAAA